MRWNVEVTAIDKTESQTVVVEAESWQRALQGARAQRGESGPISGFSIELLDEGYRAVDPMARLRYTVKRATETTSIAPPGPSPSSVTVPAAPKPTPAPPSVAPPSVSPSSAPTAVAPIASIGASPSAAPPRPTAAAASASPASAAPSASVAAAAPSATPTTSKTPLPGTQKFGQKFDKNGPPSKSGRGSKSGKSDDKAPPSGKSASQAPPVPASKRAGQTRTLIGGTSPVASPPVATPAVSTGAAAPFTNAPNAANADPTIRTNALDELPTVPNAFGSGPPVPANVGTLAASASFAASGAASSQGAQAVSSEPVPPTQVIYKREHDPSDKVPLTYREYVYAVARGVDESSAERLLRAQLENVKTSIVHAKPGKFVNMAVFDVVFQGRPPVPPLATLAWKDWKGAAVVAFPRNPSLAPSHGSVAPPAAPAPISHAPHAPHAPSPVAQPAAPPASAFVAPAAPLVPTFAPAPIAPSVAPPPPVTVTAPSPAFVAPSVAPPAPPPASAFVPHASHAPPAPEVPRDPFAPGTSALPRGVPLPPSFPQPSSPPIAAAHVAPSQVASHAPAPPPISAFTTSAPVPSSPPVAQPIAPSAPPPAQLVAHAVPSAPPPQPVQTAPIQPPPAARAPSGPKLNANMTPNPSRPALRSFSGGRRTSGDELIADLFEAMGEIHFFPDAIEAADFVLRLTMEMIPSRAALVHFYDINTREFIIASAVGASSPQLLLRRHNEGESLLSSAMRKRRAVVFPTTADTDVIGIERFNLLGGAKSLIVSPVMKGGRFLGAIEVLNPNDGLPFTDHEGNAIDYIAEQFAEFLAERGVVVDPERILRGHAANAR